MTSLKIVAVWTFALIIEHVTVSSVLGQQNCRAIDAAFSFGAGGKTVFLSGDEYIEYNFEHKSEGKVGHFSELGIYSNLRDVDAAFRVRNGNVFILKGCNYYRFRNQDETTLSLEVQGNMADLGLPCNVDAAINWAGHVLAFEGCNMWKLNEQSSRFDRDGNVTSRGLPCDLDAALEWKSSSAIFIKGTQLWTIQGSKTELSHTDNLNLCSWYLCGEADWMTEPVGTKVKCNGDERLCSLKLNQVTMAGLHNAGAGFNGGFGFLDCWMRNHALSIKQQLQNGIRHLDIDPCYDTCGLVGTCHSFKCGGSICPIIKQIRSFLEENRGEIITVNFNHEIREPEKVFGNLTTQLMTQVGPLLNDGYRSSRNDTWPTLGEAVRSNKRMFVFYAPNIRQEAFYYSIYEPNTWIHSEDLYGTTWQPFNVFISCKEVVNISAHRCEMRGYRDLMEVSIVPQMGACVGRMASRCRDYLHNSLQACQPHRFQNGKSPNVLLVDYPEEEKDSVTSVFNAVYHQNVRNILEHRKGSCRVKIDAAVRITGTDISLFFVGNKIVKYNHREKAQIAIMDAGNLTNADAAYYIRGDHAIRVIKGCQTIEVDATSLLPLSRGAQTETSCDPPDAADLWSSSVHHFKGCNVTPYGKPSIHLSTWALPCDLDAVLEDGGKLYVFKGNDYWVYSGDGPAVRKGHTLDWTIDAVQCINRPT